MVIDASISQTGTGKYEDLLSRCRSLDPIPTVVVHPCDVPSLSEDLQAANDCLIVPILVGPRPKIEPAAKSENVELKDVRVIETGKGLRNWVA
jgi:phosphate acetyltransferase